MFLFDPSRMSLCVQALYYLLFTRPNPLLGILDFYLVGPLNDQTKNKWKSSDFTLREKLGGGNFGVTYEGLKVAVRGCGVQR